VVAAACVASTRNLRYPNPLAVGGYVEMSPQALLRKLNYLDGQALALAGSLRQRSARARLAAIRRTRLGGGPWTQLARATLTLLLGAPFPKRVARVVACGPATLDQILARQRAGGGNRGREDTPTLYDGDRGQCGGAAVASCQRDIHFKD